MPIPLKKVIWQIKLNPARVSFVRCKFDLRMKKYLFIQLLTIELLLLCGIGFSQHKKDTIMSNNIITIDIWSDIVCPFCYVGKKKLEKAIEQLQLQNNVVIRWHSFELSPDFPKGVSMPATTYLTEKRGYPLAQLQQAQQHLTEQGKRYGITFNFSKSLSFNTFDVHRLWQWSKTAQKEQEFKEVFMHAYFTEGIDLSKEENILILIKQLGLDEQKATEILKSNDFSEEVLNDQKTARELGIVGVPYFIINGNQVISGAQDDRVFENALKGALKSNINDKGASCLPSGECD
jgi:predicted DsbA family dithiol-disulfide isomerase